MKRLSNSILNELPSQVARPTYDRSTLKAGILHFGVGAFHRSHEALAIDRLLEQGKAHEWAIIGVGLLPSDSRMRDALMQQDCLYTLVTKHASGKIDYQVIGSIIDYIFAPDESEKLLAKLVDPAIKIVSLTITEGGYSFDRVTGEFDPTTEPVATDLKGAAHPVSAFGYIVEGIKRRKEAGIASFTVQSCDNIQGNGDVAKKMITAFAKIKEPALADWIESHVAFPNSMVDRITPVTAAKDIELVQVELGVEDNWPVPCEPFFQWVIEDHFPAGRPPFEEVLVQMVKDVMPYELMKLRLLNASHQGLCYFGHLSGYTYVHEVMRDPLIVKLLKDYMDNEATPTLSPVPGVDLGEYKNQLIERFSNPEVQDTVARLAAESSDRIPKWLLPVVRDLLAQGKEVTLSAAIVASWARYDEAIDEKGNPIKVVDSLREELIAIAQTQRTNPLAFIENKKLFGELANDSRFAQPYLDALESLHTVGAQKTLQGLIG
jgi:mannitol 2-dehydrogenase